MPSGTHESFGSRDWNLSVVYTRMRPGQEKSHRFLVFSGNLLFKGGTISAIAGKLGVAVTGALCRSGRAPTVGPASRAGPVDAISQMEEGRLIQRKVLKVLCQVRNVPDSAEALRQLKNLALQHDLVVKDEARVVADKAREAKGGQHVVRDRAAKVVELKQKRSGPLIVVLHLKKGPDTFFTFFCFLTSRTLDSIAGKGVALRCLLPLSTPGPAASTCCWIPSGFCLPVKPWAARIRSCLVPYEFLQAAIATMRSIPATSGRACFMMLMTAMHSSRRCVRGAPASRWGGLAFVRCPMPPEISMLTMHLVVWLPNVACWS